MATTTYLYQKTNDALDELSESTGLSPTSSIWSQTDQVTLVFPNVLNEADKTTLDDYLLNHGYGFVSAT